MYACELPLFRAGIMLYSSGVSCQTDAVAMVVLQQLPLS